MTVIIRKVNGVCAFNDLMRVAMISQCFFALFLTSLLCWFILFIKIYREKNDSNEKIAKLPHCSYCCCKQKHTMLWSPCIIPLEQNAHCSKIILVLYENKLKNWNWTESVFTFFPNNHSSIEAIIACLWMQTRVCNKRAWQTNLIWKVIVKWLLCGKQKWKYESKLIDEMNRMYFYSNIYIYLMLTCDSNNKKIGIKVFVVSFCAHAVSFVCSWTLHLRLKIVLILNFVCVCIFN